MAKRVFVHIGAPKTGTTYLQTILWHNRPLLEEHGLRYPGELRIDHYDASAFVRGLPPRRNDDRKDAWPRMVAALQEWDGTGFLSHEFYMGATPEQATWAVEQLAPAEVHIVCTARDYVSQLPAYWQEAVKVGGTDTLSAYTRAMLDGYSESNWSWSTMDLEAGLRSWSAAVPPEQVHVVPMPRRNAPRTVLWERFASVLGIEDVPVDFEVATPNDSMGLVQAELVRRVASRLDTKMQTLHQRHRWLRKELAHTVLARQRGERFGVRSHEAELLRQRSQAAVDYIRAAGFDVVGDLAELVNRRPGERPHPDDVTDRELLEAAVRAFGTLRERIDAAADERDRLRERLADGRTT